MRRMFTFLAILFLLIITVWFLGFLFTNDFSIPNFSLNKYKRILLIFPHADDEILGTAGLINKASKENKQITLVILTKGEKGTPHASIDLNLKEIRANEAKSVSKFLGVTNLVQEDFGDGELTNKKGKLTSYITNLIDAKKPDLVITYDESGLYGHPDHVVVSKIITALIKEKYKNISLWYTTYPKRLLSLAKLPEHMAKDPKFRDKRKNPSFKIFTGASVISKIQAVYLYKSQYQSFRDGVPFKIPLWFAYSMWWYEYFYRVE